LFFGLEWSPEDTLTARLSIADEAVEMALSVMLSPRGQSGLAKVASRTKFWPRPRSHTLASAWPRSRCLMM